MDQLSHYKEVFDDYLLKKVITKEPKTLYEPINYILKLGGKRLRPVMVLMSAEIFNSNCKEALDAALAIEIFHNFSLVHDDIMDDAPLRRGNKTVHEKWDVNTAILSGDAMLINAYQLFENYHNSTFKELAQLFTKTAMQVCEGQQYDIDFSLKDDVSIADYLSMIEHKTAVLAGASLKMGAIVAKASSADKDAVYEYGKLLGIAFQIQDDFLDVFGNPEAFGKQLGGDIIENKKTFLYLKALELLEEKNKMQLQHLYSIEPKDPSGKIEAVKSLFYQSKAVEATQEVIKAYTNQAFSLLETINISEEKKQLLKNFGESLMNRNM